MHLDFASVAITVVLIASVSGAAVMLASAGGRDGSSLRLWGISLLVYSLQPLAYSWRSVGSLGWSIFATNIISATVLTLQWEAVARFQFRCAVLAGEVPIKLRPGKRGVLAVPLAASCLALSLLEHDTLRNIVSAVVNAALSALMIRAILSPSVRDTSFARGRLLLAGGSGLLLLTMLLRVLGLVLTGATSADLRDASGVHAATYLFNIATLLCSTLGFVLWHHEHALAREHTLAITDSLTGCLNRRALADATTTLQHSVARRLRPVAILALDLDHFKAINDQYGHPAGDQVLCETASRLRVQLRRTDILARVGGEEFIVVADETDEVGVRTLAEKLRSTIAAKPVVVDRAIIPVTVSIGVIAHNDISEMPWESLIAGGDAALYRAKAEGRNRVA